MRSQPDNTVLIRETFFYVMKLILLYKKKKGLYLEGLVIGGGGAKVHYLCNKFSFATLCILISIKIRIISFELPDLLNFQEGV